MVLPAACAALVGLRALSITLDRASPVLPTIPGVPPPPPRTPHCADPLLPPSIPHSDVPLAVGFMPVCGAVSHPDNLRPINAIGGRENLCIQAMLCWTDRSR